MSSSQSVNNMDYASILLSKPTTTSEDTFGQNLIKPNIFDIMAQENMQSLFGESFAHLITWLAQFSPMFERLARYKHELYATFHSTIEFFYLRHYDSLFSENFYGLKRHGLNAAKSKRLLSIVFSIIVPYVKTKMDSFYEELEKSVSLNELPANSTSVLVLAKRICLKYYPYFHLVWSLVFWLFRFRFIFGMSDFNSPLLRALNVRLVYNLDENKLDKHKLFTLVNKCFTSLLFFLQFFKWYQQYAENESFNSSNASPLTTIKSLFRWMNPSEEAESSGDANIIEAPKLSDKLVGNRTFQHAKANSLCPLCNKKRKNDCALTVSGFVFCYTCIFKFIKEHARCPITNYPCTTKNLVRLYVSQED